MSFSPAGGSEERSPNSFAGFEEPLGGGGREGKGNKWRENEKKGLEENIHRNKMSGYGVK